LDFPGNPTKLADLVSDIELDLDVIRFADDTLPQEGQAFFFRSLPLDTWEALRIWAAAI
jgi:hypothetical protein